MWITFSIRSKFYIHHLNWILSCLENFKRNPDTGRKMKDQEEDGSISSNLFKNKIQLFFPRVGVSEHKQVNHTREELQ